jgi:hypothetical protein
MSIKKEIENILFDLTKSIKMYRIDNENTIFEIDYDKYSDELLTLFEKYLDL